jgi:hypothetical protein
MNNVLMTATGSHEDLQSRTAERQPAVTCTAKPAASPVRTGTAPSRTLSILSILLADALRGAVEYVTSYTAGRGAE